VEDLIFGAFARPVEGESVSGDAYLIKETEDGWLIALADGLGHGALAAEASEKALSIIDRHIGEHGSEVDLMDLLRLCHVGLTGTRGAVMGLCHLNLKDKVWSSLVVGNITLRVLSHRRLNPIPAGGIVGYRLPKTVHVAEWPYYEGDTLILHTDGVEEDCSIDFPAGDQGLSVEEAAERIIEKYGTKTDDATVILGR
jgi:negative regulator of sigma-B (phosphoserine phosphatase)